MKLAALLLACLILIGALAGCNDAPVSTTPSTPKNQSPETPDDPEIEYIEMYFDDRIAIVDLIGYNSQSLVIKDQVVTSNVVGTDQADSDVLVYDEKNGRIIAVGTGTAVLTVGESEYNVRVSPAPIMLAVIAGSSSGYGSQGNKNQTVLCEAG